MHAFPSDALACAAYGVAIHITNNKTIQKRSTAWYLLIVNILRDRMMSTNYYIIEFQQPFNSGHRASIEDLRGMGKNPDVEIAHLDHNGEKC